MKKKIVFIFILVSFFSLKNEAQVVAIDSSFDIGTGFDQDVYSIALQGDQKILVGGGFNVYNGDSVKRIVRLNIDGSIDNTFNIGNGFNYSVQVIKLQVDGKILVGGYFTAYNDSVCNRIIRLNPNGSIDTSFQTGSGFNNVVTALAVQADGKIIAGGNFTSYDGIGYNRLIRLNIDGSIDVGFSIGSGCENLVKCIAIQSDNKILVGGSFVYYNGSYQYSLVRLLSNGTKDILFYYRGPTGVPSVFMPFGSIYSLLVQSTGRILVGSDSRMTGAYISHLSRLTTIGQEDTTFTGIITLTTPGFNGLNSTAKTICLQSDGKIFSGGDFTNYNGISRNRIVKLNANGYFDTSFDPGTGFNNSVTTSAVQSDDKLIVAGFFTMYNGQNRNRIVRLKSTATTTVEENALVFEELNVYPNPSSSKITCEFELSETKSVTIEIKNMLGQTVKTIDKKIFEIGKNKSEIDISDLPKGLYILEFQSKEQSSFKKFIKG